MSEIDYESLSDEDLFELGYTDTQANFLLDTEKNKKILLLKKNLTEKLKKTDHVHVSEFLTESEKTDILSIRQDIYTDYEDKKYAINNATSYSELNALDLRIS